MESAFGIEHTDRVSKHYLGQHGPEHAHERSQHSRLRRTRRATRGAYNSAAGAAWQAGHDAQVKAHPLVHAFEGYGNRSRREAGMAAHSTSAELAGQRARKDWEGSRSGRRAANSRDHARGEWNPRYGARRQAAIEARRKVGKADTRTRRLGEATGMTAGGALAARGLQASGGATQRMAYHLARNNPAAKGSFSSEKARRLRPYVQMSEKGAQIQRLGRTGSRGLALGAAGLGVATGASALQDRRRVAKSASVSAFGVEHE